MSAAMVPISEARYAPTPRDDVLIGMLRDVIPSIMRGNDTPGVSIALARHGASVWEAGFGWADLGAKIAMTPAHVFRGGSLGKLFTATAILQLEDRGALSIDDDINQHLPIPVSNPLGGGGITIRHLLSHRSGLAAWDAAGAVVGPKPQLREYIEHSLAASSSPQYQGSHTPVWEAPTGAGPRYSSLGFGLLGWIIEQCDPGRRQLADYVTQEILEPLGASKSAFDTSASLNVEELCAGYMDIGRVRMVSPEVGYACYPGQGYLGAPSDIVKLALAMLRGGALGARRILSASAVKKMLTPQGSERFAVVGTHPGLGWMLQSAGEPKMSFLHAGSHAYGWRNVCVAWPHAQTAVAISCNQIGMPKGNADLHQIMDFVASWLPHGQAEHEASGAPDWPWKLSYIRGLLFVEATRGWLGLAANVEPGEILASQVDNLAWSLAGFEQGIQDMNAQSLSADAIEAFVRSTRIRVTPDEIERAIYEFGSAPDRTLYPSLIVQAALRVVGAL